MIERYFVKGVTYTWAPLGSINPGHKDAITNAFVTEQDGTIVRSGTSAPPALTVLGLDTEIKYGSTIPPQALGMAPGFLIPHRWLHYVLGRTATVGAVGSDVLTGFMSGCRICTWTEPLKGRRVGHIGTVETAASNQPPNSTVKTAFRNGPASHLNSNLQGYNPALAWDFGSIMSVMKECKNQGGLNPQVLSLVTSDNRFYSILMLKRGPGHWACGGKKLVPSTNRATMLQELA